MNDETPDPQTEHVYHVGLREVHVNTVEVRSPTPLTREQAVSRALAGSVEDSVNIEYGHTIDDPEAHTVENLDPVPREGT